MSMKTIGLVVAVVLASVASATDFTLKEGVSGIFDWTDRNNYVGGVAPTQKELSATDRDAVVVPENVTVVISNEMPNASLALINSLARIRPNGYQTKIVFAVAENKTLTLDCAVNCEGENSMCKGTLIKEGAGDLLLTAEPNRYTFSSGQAFGAFYVHMTVTNGLLKFSQDAEKPASHVAFGRLIVNAPGVLCLPSPPNSIASSTARALSLTGDGTIRSESTSYRYLYLEPGDGTAAKPLEFSGRAEKASLSFRSKTYYNLTGTNSTGTGTLDVEGNHMVDGGRIGIRKFGKIGEPSSIGVQASNINLASRNGYWLTSIRRPDDPIDECDKNLQFFSGNGLGAATLDGGAVGGVKFLGKITEHTTYLGQKRLVLTGSNTTECVLGATFERKANADYPTGGYSVSVTKRGSGTWHFTNKSSLLSGVIAVEDGTLAYDSIANQGTASALGTARDLYRDVDAHGEVLTAADQVGYALLLGDGTDVHEGNLKYVGESPVYCASRPLAVKGRGRFTNATSHSFDFAEVYAVGTGTNVLTLDGDNPDAANTLTGIDDGKDPAAGALSLVKDGEGTWYIRGTNDIRGTISVRKGTLEIGEAYSWYKWVIKSAYAEQLTPKDTDIDINIGEVGLYAADGSRQNAGMTYTRSANGKVGEYPNVQAGHIDYGFTTADMLALQTASGRYYDLSLLTNQKCSGGGNYWYGWYRTAIYGSDKNVPHGYPENEATWLPIVMRLSDSAKPVTRFDYATVTANRKEVYRSVLYASTDGQTWEEVMPEQAIVPVATSWRLSNRAFVAENDMVHTNEAGVVDGYEIASIPVAYREPCLTNVTSYAVSSGATLKLRCNAQIRGLTLDCSGAGAGTIDGAAFAASGAIDVTGLEKGVKVATLKFNLVNTSGFANVGNWTLKENGEPTTKLSADVSDDGTVTIRRTGLMLIVR